MEITLLKSILMAVAIGIASGSIGAFIILKRMALVGDALSHVALPGIALTLAYGVDPFWGVLIFLILAAAIIWFLEERTKLPSDAIVGLLFTASLAIGILTIPDSEILESLFGEFPELSLTLLVLILLTASFLSLLTFFLAKHFIFSIVSPELSGLKKGGKYLNLVLLLIFSSVVALGIKLVGTLLMGALTIIPAAIAKNISRSVSAYLIFSASLGAFISTAGVLAAHTFLFLPGPTIILLGVALFLGSLVFIPR